MNLHDLTVTPGSKHRRIRVGRGEGGGHGKTCGRGNKGQMSRKGHKHKLGFEGGQMRLLRRIPKRGFHNHTRVEFTGINVRELARFEDGSEVTLAAMRTSGLIGGMATRIKVLGTGDLTRKLTVEAHAFSASARQKIEQAGGSCRIV